MTLTSVMQSDAVPTGAHAANAGNHPVAQVVFSVEILAEGTQIRAIILFGIFWDTSPGKRNSLEPKTREPEAGTLSDARYEGLLNSSEMSVILRVLSANGRKRYRCLRLARSIATKKGSKSCRSNRYFCCTVFGFHEAGFFGTRP